MSRIRRVRKLMRRVGEGAKNALDIIQEGRVGAPYFAPHEVVHEAENYRLRRYLSEETEERPPLLLVPPLMVTSEVYDISPELSAIAELLGAGLDVWLCDYGAPEAEEGGMERTLDDHVLSVDDAIERIKEETGRDVHLGGYSQGGMFCYQAAAYRRSEDIASIITFGSPVDIHRNMPLPMHEDLAERVIGLAKKGIDGPLEKMEGLPGSLSSRGFKLLSPGKEMQQIFEFFGLLHDREALEKREPTRLFLGGEGFVAWPGPALEKFIDEFIVGNRMASGGFVIAGRTSTLADITSPILYFYGERDDFARPPSVKAIEKAAPKAEKTGVSVSAGHFGLVVGSRALGEVWPRVVSWVKGDGAADATEGPHPKPLSSRGEGLQSGGGTGRLYDLATDVIDGLWHRLGDASLEVSRVVDSVRWQLPRLARIESLEDESRVNIGRALADQATAIPDETFFLWRGRAYTYEQANIRVNQVLDALMKAGMTSDSHVGVLMDNHPDYLTSLAAVNRLGGVSVLLNTGMRGMSLEQAIETADVDFIITDADHADTADEVFDGTIAVFGATSKLPEGQIDLEDELDPEVTEPPDEIEADAGKVKDLAMLIFTSGTTGHPKAARITNGRWAMAALGTAAACALTPKDTVYCPLPLYHATGLLIGVGGALVGGARLALTPKFSTRTFWEEVRRYGATVVVYVGELCRYLVNQPEEEGEGRNPVRLFVGNGMRPEVWRELEERFEPDRILEFYGATEANVALANFTGRKVGSVGRPLPGTNQLELVKYDFETDEFVRDGQGHFVRVDVDEPGVLLSRISDEHPLAHFDGYLSEEDTERKTLRNVFENGDAYFNTGDLLRVDEDGDYWFVDRVGDTFRWKGENVSTEQVAQAVSLASFVDMAVVYGVKLPGHEGRCGMAAIVLEEGAEFDGEELFEIVASHTFPAARPRFVRVVDELDTTDSFKFVKFELQQEGADPDDVDDPLYLLDEIAGAYVPMDPDAYSNFVSV